MSSATDHVLAAVADDLDAARVVHAARRLAAAARVGLRVVHAAAVQAPAVVGSAQTPSPTLDLSAPPVVYGAEMSQRAERRAREEARVVLERMGVEEHEAEVLTGDPVSALLERLAERRPWAAVVGTRGRGVLRATMLGSTSRALMREAPCPVVVVPPTAGEPFAGGPVVCALDEPGARSDAALAAAVAFGDRLGRRLVLAHVQPGGDPRRDVDAELQAARSLLGDRDAEVALRWGRPADELRILAEKLGADALIVASRGEGGLRPVLRGSVAIELTGTAPCPVLAVPSERHVPPD